MKEVKNKTSYRSIQDLEKLENNPRFIKEKEFEKLKRSIAKNQDYFEARPLILSNRTGKLVVLAGNQRYEAAKALGMAEVPTVLIEGLTEEQEKDIVIRDNITNGEWDMDIIADWWTDNEEAAEIIKNSFKSHDYFGDERERTYKSMNLDKYDNIRIAGEFDFPTLAPADAAPEALIGFNEAKTAKNYNVGIHFFIDDYQFERLWNTPDKYIKNLEMFDCVFTPDFSLYADMPLAMKIWNVFRSRLIGQFMQDKGLVVIPTLSWAGEETYDFCFDGLPSESTYAVSTVGVLKSAEALDMWKGGMNEAIKRLKPKKILLYGSDVEFDWGNVEVRKYGNKALKRV